MRFVYNVVALGFAVVGGVAFGCVVCLLWSFGLDIWPGLWNFALITILGVAGLVGFQWAARRRR